MPGPADESGQKLIFEVGADDPLLFAVQPAIDPVTGTLTFTPVNGAAGTATITVVLRDNGGGADASAPATFTITLTAPALPPGVQINGTELVITGGAGNDSITLATVSGGNGSNGVKITGNLNGQAINKTYKQTFTSIRISTDGGSDTVKIADGITLPTIVDAGTGDDTVQGGDGNDFLIGGLGADLLSGQNGDDILVAGLAAVRKPATDSLRQVIADWNPTVAGIYDSLRGRLSITDDPAAIDNLQGNAGTDWFWSADPLDVLDLGPGEQRN